jgi:hypothetical protein
MTLFSAKSGLAALSQALCVAQAITLRNFNEWTPKKLIISFFQH